MKEINATKENDPEILRRMIEIERDQAMEIQAKMAETIEHLKEALRAAGIKGRPTPGCDCDYCTGHLTGTLGRCIGPRMVCVPSAQHEAMMAEVQQSEERLKALQARNGHYRDLEVHFNRIVGERDEARAALRAAGIKSEDK